MSGLIRPSSVGPHELKLLIRPDQASRAPPNTASVTAPTDMTFFAPAQGESVS